MKSFKDIYGKNIENARDILKEISEDISGKYPNNDFIIELDALVNRLDEMKENMKCYPI